MKLNIEKMSCEGCVKNITKGLNEIGITELNFDLPNKNVEISDQNIDEKNILKTLKRMNYPAVKI